MTTSPAHLRLVGGWLNDLATLVAGNTPLAEAKAKIAAIAGLLAEDFPHGETFSRPSLTAIAKELTFFPSYAELVKQLNRWWDANRPKQTALPGADVDMPAADRSMVIFWQEYRAGKAFPHGVTFESWLSMIRRPTPAAFAYLVRTDTLAQEIAERRRWMFVPEPPPDAEQQAEVARTTRGIVEHGLRSEPPAQTGRMASKAYDDPPASAVPPAHMAASPAQPPSIDERARAFEAKHGRKPGALTPEQLEIARAAVGGMTADRRARDQRAAAARAKPPDPPQPTEAELADVVFPWMTEGNA